MTFILPETDGLSKAVLPFASLPTTDLLQISPFSMSPSLMVERLTDLQVSLFESTMKLWLSPFGQTSDAATRAAPAPLPDAGPASETPPAAAPVSASASKVVTLQPKPASIAKVEAPAPASVAAARAPAETAGETAPALLAQPEGEADDLERIVGIGPKLKKTLNDTGIWHFRQIAAWTPEEVSWVNTKIAFKGRIEREGWQKQASRLSRSANKAA